MPLLSSPQLFILIIVVLANQCILIVQAGNCFQHRANNICYELSEADTAEELCTGLYYSDDVLQELDGYAYAENCRNVNVVSKPKYCDVDCGLGQECQWIDNEEMCVCSEESCNSSDMSEVKQPVCASNNMTFASLCVMEAWKCRNYRSSLYVKYDGECQKDCQNVRCPNDKICLLVKNTGEPICYPKSHCNSLLNPDPVCGTDGVTYSNICAMRQSPDRYGQTPDLAHNGPCEAKCRPGLCQPDEHCVLSSQSKPVCIRCQYSPSSLKLSGECNIGVPICGDDGRLYTNYCSLLIAQCKRNKYINVTGYGTCPNATHKKVNRKNKKYPNKNPKL